MGEVSRLLLDLGRTDFGPRRAHVLSGIVDLFALGAETFEADHLAVFDSVFEQLLVDADETTRTSIAGRIGPLEHVPPRLLVRLANDEIAVARPVLALSPVLTDQDLVAVCVARGRDHMLAVCERARLSELVTDVLVARGDGVVRHAVAANATARFSRLSVATLLTFARGDGSLLELLGERRDLPEGQGRQVARLLRDAATMRLNGKTPVEEPAEGADLPTERGLAHDARTGRHASVLAALAFLSGLPMARVRRLYEEGDDELLIVIARARGWSFETVRAIMTHRTEPAGSRAIRSAEASFDSLSTTTAARILRFIRLRHNGSAQSSAIRSNVR